MAFKISKIDLRDFRDIAEVLDEDNPNVYADWFRMTPRVPAYRNKERYLVIKRANFIMNPWTPLKVRVPTIKLDKYGWVVQPYCERYRLKEAVQLIAKQLGKNHGCDLHYANVGWICERGKMVPKMFDW